MSWWRSCVGAWAFALALLLGGASWAPEAALASQMAAATPVCRACNGAISGRYIVDSWQDAFHPEHSAVQRCLFCTRAITAYTDPGRVLPGGHWACGSCAARGVYTPARAAALQEDTRRRMARWGVVLPANLPLRLASEAELHAKSRTHPGQGATVRGITERSSWVNRATGQQMSRQVSFLMMVGMPPEEFQAVMAHEMMHAWIFLDKQPDHSSSLEEGSCNLAAYYILQELANPAADRVKAQMYRALDPVYGEGLRRAIRVVQARQFPALVDILRRSRDFPAGS